MRNRFVILLVTMAVTGPSTTGFAQNAAIPLMKKHCYGCHNDRDTEGDFSLNQLNGGLKKETIETWIACLDRVESEEMPPPDDSKLSDADRATLVKGLKQITRSFEKSDSVGVSRTRRLNNREFANSVRDVLLLDHIGTHLPTDGLIGDPLHKGFDTHGESLGISEFHLEQYINAVRKIVDAVIIEKRVEPYHYEIKPGHIDMRLYSHKVAKAEAKQANKLREVNEARALKGRPPLTTLVPDVEPNEMPARDRDYFDLNDPNRRAYFENFETVPSSGWYRIRINATGIDRGVYPMSETGVYHDDPVQLTLHLGNLEKTFDLPDNDIVTLELEEWLAAGTVLELQNPTDGFRVEKSGTFKFQYNIAHRFIKKNDPAKYQTILDALADDPRSKPPKHWGPWVKHWQGARPRIFKAEVKGPFYKTWPSKRQAALIGIKPTLQDTADILRPIAERAFRRNVRDEELAPYIALVQKQAESMSTISALKEGIVTILASPSFLYLNSDAETDSQRFATHLSYFLRSTTPDAHLHELADTGDIMRKEVARTEVERILSSSEADEFLTEFPMAWLQLERINFMVPDPARYRFYNRKKVNEDMVQETLVFFQHAVKNNLPIIEFLSADYSFINADLAQVYGVDVPQDSTFRKYTFNGGRRGGLLGMGAILTLTADSLNTSPIHRAVYVMENILGLHPEPPPPDVETPEPDVSKALSIREVIAAHRSDRVCASCHRNIDPYGFAFENFDSIGAWRDNYTLHIDSAPNKKKLEEIEATDRSLKKRGLPPTARPWEEPPIPVDASERFPDGDAYHDIVEYRKILLTPRNQERFVRCFITKLLTYANGVEPLAADRKEIDDLVTVSEKHDYRIVDTIAAVINSPLFVAN